LHQDRRSAIILVMPCLIGCMAIGFPRITLLLVWLLNPNLISAAFASILVPILGLLFLPLTTLAYVWASTFQGGPWGSGGVIVIIVAVVFDLGTYGGSAKVRRK